MNTTRSIVHIITSLDSGGAERMLTRIATYDCSGEAWHQVVVSLMDEGVYGARLRGVRGIGGKCKPVPIGDLADGG